MDGEDGTELSQRRYHVY